MEGEGWYAHLRTASYQRQGGKAIAMKISRTLMKSYYTCNFTKEIQGVTFTNKHTESSTLGFLLEEVTC